MKHFVDGDQLCITRDDFENLQESPAVFYSLSSSIAKTVLSGGILSLCIGDLLDIKMALDMEKAAHNYAPEEL
jgi:hypothetical protein